MEPLRSFARRHGINLLAILLFGSALARYVYLAEWYGNLPLVLLAAVGLLMVLVSETFAEILGHSSLHVRSPGDTSPLLTRIGGLLALGLGIYALL